MTHTMRGNQALPVSQSRPTQRSCCVCLCPCLYLRLCLCTRLSVSLFQRLRLWYLLLRMWPCVLALLSAFAFRIYALSLHALFATAFCQRSCRIQRQQKQNM